jgi:hypothetical protein
MAGNGDPSNTSCTLRCPIRACHSRIRLLHRNRVSGSFIPRRGSFGTDHMESLSSEVLREHALTLIEQMLKMGARARCPGRTSLQRFPKTRGSLPLTSLLGLVFALNVGRKRVCSIGKLGGLGGVRLITKRSVVGWAEHPPRHCAFLWADSSFTQTPGLERSRRGNIVPVRSLQE